MEAPGYWDDTEKSQAGMRELKNLKDEAEDYGEFKASFGNIASLKSAWTNPVFKRKRGRKEGREVGKKRGKEGDRER